MSYKIEIENRAMYISHRFENENRVTESKSKFINTPQDSNRKTACRFQNQNHSIEIEIIT